MTYKHCDKWQTSLWYIWPIHFWTFLVQTRGNSPSMNQESRKHWINCFEKIPLTSYCTSKASKNDRCVISMRRIVLIFAYLSAFRAFAFYSDPVRLKKRHCTFKSIWFGNILRGSSVFYCLNDESEFSSPGSRVSIGILLCQSITFGRLKDNAILVNRSECFVWCICNY